MNFKDFREKLTEESEIISEDSADPAYLRKLLRGVKVNVGDREIPVNIARVLRGINIFNRTGKRQSIPSTIAPHYDAYLNRQQALSAKFANRSMQLNGEEVVVEAKRVDDPPPVITLKRAGIRIFPDGRRVALYNNAQLGLLFSVPYDENFGTNVIPGVKEE